MDVAADRQGEQGIRKSEAKKGAVVEADLLETLAAVDLIAKVDPSPEDVVKGRMGMAIAVPVEVAQEWELVDFVADRVVQVQADALADGLRVGAQKAGDLAVDVRMLRKVLVEAGHPG